MTSVFITGYPEGKKIHAIKGLRGATGLGLKESKDIIDDADLGRETKVTVADRAACSYLDEYGVRYRLVPTNVTVGDFVEVLSRFPRSSTVADLLSVLVVVRDIEADAAAQA